LETEERLKNRSRGDRLEFTLHAAQVTYDSLSALSITVRFVMPDAKGGDELHNKESGPRRNAAI
jgi:hypothetical protein